MNYYKSFSVFVLLAVVFYASTSALPRDSSIAKSETVSKNPDIGKMKVIPEQAGSQFGIPGRITCPYEEATEHSSCQEHCLPKGYTYGICVGGTCSCI